MLPGEIATAVLHFEKALILDPSNAAALLHLATAKQALVRTRVCSSVMNWINHMKPGHPNRVSLLGFSSTAFRQPEYREREAGIELTCTTRCHSIL